MDYVLNATAKLQNLKAIHNPKLEMYIDGYAECDCKITKFESNSQPSLRQEFLFRSLNATAKLQNLKAIHNR